MPTDSYLGQPRIPVSSNERCTWSANDARCTLPLGHEGRHQWQNDTRAAVSDQVLSDRIMVLEYNSEHAANTFADEQILELLRELQRRRAAETTVAQIESLRTQLADSLCAEDNTCQRLRDCEISLGTFDSGATSEYWLKYGSTAVKTERPRLEPIHMVTGDPHSPVIGHREVKP